MPLQNTFAFVTKLQEYRAKLDHLPLQRLTRFRWHLVTQLVRERNYFLNQLFLKFSAFGKGQPFSDTFGATAVAVIEEFMTPDVFGVSGVSLEKSTFESDRAIMALYAR